MARVSIETMRSRKKNRRKFVRRKKQGMALLAPVNSDGLPILGVLIDVSEGGFRARHSYGGLPRNHVVSFIHRFRKGAARVIWNQATDRDFEAGFEYLDASDA
jgi:hypothetical protein